MCANLQFHPILNEQKMKERKPTIILGIDPGTTVMGYGLIRITKKPELLQLGVLRLRKYASHYEKLKIIFESTQRIIQNYNPTVCAVEAPFYGKNVQSMLKLGRAQGTAITAAVTSGIEVVEYSPKKIKQSVTGNGNASKDQVCSMLGHILKEDITDQVPLDATDGLAAAVCHYFQMNSAVSGGKSFSGWADYEKQNPDKIRK